MMVCADSRVPVAPTGKVGHDCKMRVGRRVGVGSRHSVD